MTLLLETDLDEAARYRSVRDGLDAASRDERAAVIADRARDTRRSIVRMIADAGQGHIGGDLSVTDILTVLYWAVLRVDPTDPAAPERDRFILSKGHCAGALYSTLAHCGFFPAGQLSTFMRPLAALNGHPNRTKVPGVETNTGPLGHGLPVAVGAAIGAKLRRSPSTVWVVLGDGEMQEGSNWEALLSAAHHGLDNLTVIVDRNRLQQGARTEDTTALDPLDDKLAAFGMEVRVVDGHDLGALYDAFTAPRHGRPVAVIARTIKGRGVSFMEDRVEWHHKVPNADQIAQALEELS